MTLEPVIGLEIHVQLKSKSKMYCSCSTHVPPNAPPNTNICPICLGHPGTLPVVNAQAVRFGILFGLAVHGEIPSYSKFDRKNYFYPDLPKGYQISQYDLPIVKGGYLDIEVPGVEKPNIRIGLTRAHLEEDAAKNIHAEGSSLIDFNRAGTPLLEIVTEPDFRSPEEAKAFLQELRLLVRTLGIGDGDMEKGQMRCDANISMRQLDEDGNCIGLLFNPKVEVKNVNSFRNVERALAYEIKRQTKLWEAGTPPASNVTRSWNDVGQRTDESRSKENAADYRYFPDPDLPPLQLAALAEELKSTLPELPDAKRRRFVEEYGFSKADARQLVEDPALSTFAEETISELGGWLQTQTQEEDVEAAQKKLMKMTANWIINKLGGLLNERGIDLRIAKVTPENFAELITLIGSGRVTQATAGKILDKMLDGGEDPSQIMEDEKLGKMEDAGALADVVDRVLANFPKDVERYRAGEKQLLKFFIGMIMKETEGNADPGEASNILKVKLEKG